MNRFMDALPTGGLFSAEGKPKEMIAAGSLVAGVGLFVLSVLVVLAVGFFAGALVMIENVARGILGKEEEEPEVEQVRMVMPRQTSMVMPQRTIGEVEMA